MVKQSIEIVSNCQAVCVKTLNEIQIRLKFYSFDVAINLNAGFLSFSKFRMILYEF